MKHKTAELEVHASPEPGFLTGVVEAARSLGRHEGGAAAPENVGATNPDVTVILRFRHEKPDVGQLIETTHATYSVIEVVPHPQGGWEAGCRIDILYATDIDGNRLP